MLVVLVSLQSASAMETDKSGRAVEVDLVATDVDLATSLHTSMATVGEGEEGRQ